MGGIESVIKNLSENLVKMGHLAKVICLTNKDTSSFEIINGVEVFRIKDNYYNYLMDFSLEFSKFFNSHKQIFDEADVINIHSYHTLFSWQTIRFLNKKGYKNKLIFTPHYEGIGFSVTKNFLHKIYRFVAKSSFDIPIFIVCVSEYEKNNLSAKFIGFERKICIIPNGIGYSVPKYYMIKKVSNKKIKLLYVGRIEKKKGIQYALEAVKYLTDTTCSEIEFTVVGTGSYLGELQNITEKHKLNNVHFLGKVSNERLQSLYKNSDIFLLLSKSEAYGIVVAEALVNGLIVIVSRKTALTEFLSENGCFGINYPPKNIELANLIYDLSTKEVLIGPFDKNKICEWGEVAKRYESLYSDMALNTICNSSLL
jgi:glycosyltransferase involved in cell wall biosynthesis